MDDVENGKLNKYKLNKMKTEEKERAMVSAFMNPSFLKDYIEAYRNTIFLLQVASKRVP